jgi:hypothetical protein
MRQLPTFSKSSQRLFAHTTNERTLQKTHCWYEQTDLNSEKSVACELIISVKLYDIECELRPTPPTKIWAVCCSCTAP